MPATLKSVAARLNMSVSTVSRVVNNKAFVKPETREKVLHCLKELNYTPNQIARSLKIRSTNTIGIIVPDISEDFFSYVIKGVDNVLSKNEYTIILCDTGEDPQKEEVYLNLLTQKQIDGVILATVNKRPEKADKLIKEGLPVILIDNLPELKSNFDSVIIDNIKASFMAVEYLIKLGHKKIGIITGKTDETTGYERLRGYKKALLYYDIVIENDLIKFGDFKENSGYRNMNELLDADNGLTAVYVASSKMTFGAIKAIRERKLKIPENISLVGFDVHDETGLITPGITTIIQPEQHIGKAAAELMIKRLAEPDNKYRQKIVLDPELMIKDSCGHLPGTGKKVKYKD